MMAKVIIVIEGGCMQEIQSDDPTIDIFVVDYDAQEETPGSTFIDGHIANVWPATTCPITLDI